MRKRNWLLIAIIALVVIVAVFPTPHTRTMEDLVETLDCTRTLEDDESILEGWVDMQDQTKIIIDFHSSEDVTVTITCGELGSSMPIYNDTKKLHADTFTLTCTKFEMSINNPTSIGMETAVMSGSIKAYRIYEIQQWLPWWMP